MQRYYFDVRDGDHVTRDEDGMELISIEAAWGKPLFRLPISQWMQSQFPAQTCLAVKLQLKSATIAGLCSWLR